MDSLGYARFRDWRIYGEERLARKEAAVWLQPGSLTVEYGGEPLSRYGIELAQSSGKPRRPRPRRGPGQLLRERRGGDRPQGPREDHSRGGDWLTVRTDGVGILDVRAIF